MDSKELFNLWAPDFRDWSAWAKPIAFAGPEPVIEAPPPAEAPPIDVSWAPTSRDTVIILDLPGAIAVQTGLALISRSYWPVPLFNGADGISAVVPIDDIRMALWQGEAALQNAPLDPHAPPVFLLDSNRMPRMSAMPGQFDNRWFTFPQDFPSANLLLSKGIKKAIVRQDGRAAVQNDLAHVLLRWQKAGISMELKLLGQQVQPVSIAKPVSFGAWWYVAMAMLGLHHNSAGGFGSIVPIPSQGGGWG
ncbi:MAG TPA: hypothetical protein VMD30_02785 [Tepidisphaeraceae bacterium]|nr:hypothetical protein [Tepidisphaeraceae bacterium]